MGPSDIFILILCLLTQFNLKISVLDFEKSTTVPLPTSLNTWMPFKTRLFWKKAIIHMIPSHNILPVKSDFKDLFLTQIQVLRKWNHVHVWTKQGLSEHLCIWAKDISGPVYVNIDKWITMKHWQMLC